jgi:hypothetical protein
MGSEAGDISRKKGVAVADLDAEVAWLVQHRAKEVRALVRGFRGMTRGRRAGFGVGSSYLVSLLELGLKKEAARKRSKSRRAK